MLILTKKLGERITIGGDIVISLINIKGSQIKLGIKVPKNVSIHRQEIYKRIKAINLKSSEVRTSVSPNHSLFYPSKDPRRKKIEG
jgi:carbon storage regulator